MNVICDWTLLFPLLTPPAPHELTMSTPPAIQLTDESRALVLRAKATLRSFAPDDTCLGRDEACKHVKHAFKDQHARLSGGNGVYDALTLNFGSQDESNHVSSYYRISRCSEAHDPNKVRVHALYILICMFRHMTGDLAILINCIVTQKQRAVAHELRMDLLKAIGFFLDCNQSGHVFVSHRVGRGVVSIEPEKPDEGISLRTFNHALDPIDVREQCFVPSVAPEVETTRERSTRLVNDVSLAHDRCVCKCLIKFNKIRIMLANWFALAVDGASISTRSDPAFEIGALRVSRLNLFTSGGVILDASEITRLQDGAIRSIAIASHNYNLSTTLIGRIDGEIIDKHEWGYSTVAALERSFSAFGLESFTSIEHPSFEKGVKSRDAGYINACIRVIACKIPELARNVIKREHLESMLGYTCESGDTDAYMIRTPAKANLRPAIEALLVKENPIHNVPKIALLCKHMYTAYMKIRVHIDSIHRTIELGDKYRGLAQGFVEVLVPTVQGTPPDQPSVLMRPLNMRLPTGGELGELEFSDPLPRPHVDPVMFASPTLFSCMYAIVDPCRLVTQPQHRAILFSRDGVARYGQAGRKPWCISRHDMASEAYRRKLADNPPSAGAVEFAAILAAVENRALDAARGNAEMESESDDGGNEEKSAQSSSAQVRSSTDTTPKAPPPAKKAKVSAAAPKAPRVKKFSAAALNMAPGVARTHVRSKVKSNFPAQMKLRLQGGSADYYFVLASHITERMKRAFYGFTTDEYFPNAMDNDKRETIEMNMMVKYLDAETAGETIDIVNSGTCTTLGNATSTSIGRFVPLHFKCENNFDAIWHKDLEFPPKPDKALRKDNRVVYKWMERAYETHETRDYYVRFVQLLKAATQGRELKSNMCLDEHEQQALFGLIRRFCINRDVIDHPTIVRCMFVFGMILAHRGLEVRMTQIDGFAPGVFFTSFGAPVPAIPTFDGIAVSFFDVRLLNRLMYCAHGWVTTWPALEVGKFRWT